MSIRSSFSISADIPNFAGAKFYDGLCRRRCKDALNTKTKRNRERAKGIKASHCLLF